MIQVENVRRDFDETMCNDETCNYRLQTMWNSNLWNEFSLRIVAMWNEMINEKNYFILYSQCYVQKFDISVINIVIEKDFSLLVLRVERNERKYRK